MFYTEVMPHMVRKSAPASLSLKLGWLEAHATGWGVAAIPVVVALVLVADALKFWAG
jgi:hypothetical protein